MRITYSKSFLLFAATLLLTSRIRAVAASPDTHPAKSSLDNAVSAKQCPATPVNVPASDKESANTLLKRITISGDKLNINGTDDPDHIVVSSGGSSQLVRVAWDGKQLGSFGPVKKIELRGQGGDDVLIVKSGVTLPVLIDGGSGDDCVQGGSGADQLLGGDGDDVLIAGTGRPALSAGAGADRIVIPQRMGTIQYAPSTDSEAVQALNLIYNLQPLSQGAGEATNTPPSPMLLGPADLGEEQIKPLLQQTYAAGQAIVLVKGTGADAERLRNLLGHPNTAKIRKETGIAPGDTAPVVFFRKAPRPGTKAYDYSIGFFNTLNSSLSDRMIESISQVLSATAIVPEAPSGSPSNDLQQLANSYTANTITENSEGSGLQITDSVWAVRSFDNQEDFYYVLQEADYWAGLNQSGGSWHNSAQSYLNDDIATLLQPSPESSQCTTSTTSSLSWNIGGSTGYNEMQGLNALISGGVSVSNSKTISCPPTTIINRSNPYFATTLWDYWLSTPSHRPYTQSFYNQWIWQIPTKYYAPQQQVFEFTSTGNSIFGNCGSSPSCNLFAEFNPAVPLPFGDTFALQTPVVSSVSPTCVFPGQIFYVKGTGMYPSLVSSVLIDGTPLSPLQYVPISDTKIRVTAPDQPAIESQPVVVQTSVPAGQSNSNVSIEIPYLYCSDSAAGGKKK